MVTTSVSVVCVMEILGKLNVGDMGVDEGAVPGPEGDDTGDVVVLDDIELCCLETFKLF